MSVAARLERANGSTHHCLHRRFGHRSELQIRASRNLCLALRLGLLQSHHHAAYVGSPFNNKAMAFSLYAGTETEREVIGGDQAWIDFYWAM